MISYNSFVLPCTAAEHLGIPLSNALGSNLIKKNIRHFTGEEQLIEINQNLSNSSVIIVQSVSSNVNTDIIELLLTINAARNAGSKHIHLVLAYIPYSRQDRQMSIYSSIGVDVIGRIIGQSQIDTITTIDIHNLSSLALFNKPIFNISSIDIINRYIDITNKTLVLPDKGSVMRNKMKDVVYLEKTRKETISFELHGAVEGKECIIVDDMIDTGQTLCLAADKLIDAGAKSVVAYATHALFSDKSCHLINSSSISELIVSNSISNIYRPSHLEVIDITDIILDTLNTFE